MLLLISSKTVKENKSKLKNDDFKIQESNETIGTLLRSVVFLDSDKIKFLCSDITRIIIKECEKNNNERQLSAKAIKEWEDKYDKLNDEDKSLFKLNGYVEKEGEIILGQKPHMIEGIDGVLIGYDVHNIITPYLLPFLFSEHSLIKDIYMFSYKHITRLVCNDDFTMKSVDGNGNVFYKELHNELEYTGDFEANLVIVKP